MLQAYLYGIGASIRIGQDIWCLPYKGFLIVGIPELKCIFQNRLVVISNFPAQMASQCQLNTVFEKIQGILSN